jgi:hypothetical protein
MTQHLSITTFRYVPRDLPQTPDTEPYLQRLNEELLTRVERSGEAFLSNAMVNGRFALRVASSASASLADIEALLPILARHGRDAERAVTNEERRTKN